VEKRRRETQGETLNNGTETISLLSYVDEMAAGARLRFAIDDGMQEGVKRAFRLRQGQVGVYEFHTRLG